MGAEGPPDAALPKPPPTVDRDFGAADAPIVDLSSDDLVRTEPHSPEEVEDMLRGALDPSANVSGPTNASGDFAFKPDVVRAEGLTGPGFDAEQDAMAVSAADAAMQAQGDLVRYPGVDFWENGVAEAGDRVSFANDKDPSRVQVRPDGTVEREAPSGGWSGFGVPEGDQHDGEREVGMNAARLGEGAQIAPNNGRYRECVDYFEFTEDVPVATGLTTENTQYGSGGIRQMYVPQVDRLISEGTLKYVGTTRMNDTSASPRVHRP